MTNNREIQKAQIQSEVDRFFRRHIDISPRAMAAMEGRWREGTEEPDPSYTIPAISIFEGLLASSPSCLALLFGMGIPVEKLFSVGKEEGTGVVTRNSLEWIFRGNTDTSSNLNLCSAGSNVRKKQSLTEIDLLFAFVQTAYRGPLSFSEKVDANLLSKYTTDVGDRLMRAGFVDAEEVREEWDGRPDTYRARSIAAKLLKDLSKRIHKVEIADPSHEQFQFAIWLDTKGSIRICPFGVGTLGSLAPSYIKQGQAFVFREGIFQPISSILPGFDEDIVFQLEEMINSNLCNEQDFQHFFERYPEFLTSLDYKQVHPQLALYNEDDPNLIPDFMLEPMSSQFCDILELKLPYGSLVKRLSRQSRKNFRSLINEAISQLVEYRRYFDSKQHRKEFYAQYGLKAYRPKMILVVGRKHHFRSDVERQELRDLLPRDLEIWTYDDLLARAKKYHECIAKAKTL